MTYLVLPDVLRPITKRGKEKAIFMDEFSESLFKIPNKMTNEWIDYAENVHVRTPFKYPSNNNSLITNNNSFLTANNMHHQPPQQFYNKMGIKPFNNNLNNNNSNALNQYSLMNKFQKPSRGELKLRSNRTRHFQDACECDSHFRTVEIIFTQKTATSLISLTVKNRPKKLFPLSFQTSGCVCRKQFLTPSPFLDKKFCRASNKVLNS